MEVPGTQDMQVSGRRQCFLFLSFLLPLSISLIGYLPLISPGKLSS